MTAIQFLLVFASMMAGALVYVRAAARKDYWYEVAGAAVLIADAAVISIGVK